ncbi:hypothetical protein CVT24_001834 [Panaeolus cyanescens]|uniref:Uncharacterized protein n=1 Tax=Panaeolus cyanescens TaxID=181874 RepID=A0A409WSF4_9AGAR|nr:hypothetical protein CVT24_001834 [Panaeolus cyanescens]
MDPSSEDSDYEDISILEHPLARIKRKNCTKLWATHLANEFEKQQIPFDPVNIWKPQVVEEHALTFLSFQIATSKPSRGNTQVKASTVQNWIRTYIYTLTALGSDEIQVLLHDKGLCKKLKDQCKHVSQRLKLEREPPSKTFAGVFEWIMIIQFELDSSEGDPEKRVVSLQNIVTYQFVFYTGIRPSSISPLTPESSERTQFLKVEDVVLRQIRSGVYVVEARFKYFKGHFNDYSVEVQKAILKHVSRKAFLPLDMPSAVIALYHHRGLFVKKYKSGSEILADGDRDLKTKPEVAKHPIVLSTNARGKIQEGSPANSKKVTRALRKATQALGMEGITLLTGRADTLNYASWMMHYGQVLTHFIYIQCSRQKGQESTQALAVHFNPHTSGTLETHYIRNSRDIVGERLGVVRAGKEKEAGQIHRALLEENMYESKAIDCSTHSSQIEHLSYSAKTFAGLFFDCLRNPSRSQDSAHQLQEQYERALASNDLICPNLAQTRLLIAQLAIKILENEFDKERNDKFTTEEYKAVAQILRNKLGPEESDMKEALHEWITTLADQ